MDVGAGEAKPFVIRKVHEHRELLDEDVRMRLEPEARLVLAILDAQPRTCKIRARRFLDHLPDERILESTDDVAADAKPHLVLGREVNAGRVVRLTPSVENRIGRRSERKPRDRIDVGIGNGVLEQPVVERPRLVFGACKAGEERVRYRVRGNRRKRGV